MSTSERRLHDRILELAATGLDFRLAASEVSELDAHLARCPACARTAAALRADTTALRRPAALIPSRRVDAAVAAAIAGRDPRTSPQRMFVLVAATALLLVALLGVAAAGAFILRTWLPTVVVPLPSPPVVVVNPSPSPAPVWRVAPIPPMFEGQQPIPVAVAGGESGFAAVGGRLFRDVEAPSGGTASAWRSADGATWEPVPADDSLATGDGIPVDDEPMPGFADVAWGPGGYVAVGIVIVGSDRVGATWHSSDGLTWTRTQLPEPERTRPAAVTWNGSTFVLVGVVRQEDAPRAAAWLSADGRSWRRVADSGAFDIGGYITYPSAMGSGGLADVTPAADGSLVAVGHKCSATTRMEEQSVCQPIVLRSADGESWNAVPGPAATGAGLSSVAAQGARYLATAGGPGGMQYVQAPGPVLPDGDAAHIALGDGAGWRLVEPSGVPRLDRVAAAGEGFVAVSSTSNRITLWVSPDGEAWSEVAGVPQPPLLPDWEADMQAFSDVDLVVAGDRVAIIGRSNGGDPEWGAFAIVGSTDLLGLGPVSPAVSPSPAPPVAVWQVAPGAFPVASGTAVLAPGPDGGTYVLVTTADAGSAQNPGRSVLALLDPAGEPRTGWPVAVDGWSCANPYAGAWPPDVADDGSVTVACLSWDTPDGSVRMSAARFDAAGTQVASWAYDGEPSGRPRVVGDRLIVIASEVTEQQVMGAGGQEETRVTAAYWLEAVASDGTRRSGARVDVGEGGWPVVLRPDGTAYHLDMANGVITAFDMDGQRTGWPVRLDGELSALGFGADGRVYVSVASATGGTSRLVVLAPDGSTVARSDPLPLVGTSAYSGAGPDGSPMAPLVADDGTAFVIGEAGDHTVVYAIDSSGAVMGGWPYRADTEVQWQGTCPAETAGCGVWRATAAVGPDGVVYLPLAAPDAQVGGSVVAIGRDGKAVAGWPMHLARRGAEFWAAAAGPGDTAWALAVEPETTGGFSSTILAFATDGTVRSRTTVIDPKSAR